MSSDNVDILPIWKKDSTPEEFLSELAMIARKKTSILELLGLIESGKHQALVQCTRE